MSVAKKKIKKTISKRTQKERTAATRLKLIRATITILSTNGYAATSTALIADLAGISRGSIFHNFETRTDLMLAVVDYVLADDLEFYEDALEHIEDGREFTLALTDLSWEALSSPNGLAVLHIMIGSVSDAELGEKLPHVLANVRKLATKQYQSTVRQKTPIAQFMSVAGRVHRAAVRGLLVEVMTGTPRGDLVEELKLLRRYMEFSIDFLAPAISSNADNKDS